MSSAPTDDDRERELLTALGAHGLFLRASGDARIQLAARLADQGLTPVGLELLARRAAAVARGDKTALLARWLQCDAWSAELRAAERAAARAPGDRPAPNFAPADAAQRRLLAVTQCWGELADGHEPPAVAARHGATLAELRNALLAHAGALATSSAEIHARLIEDQRERCAALRRWLRDAAARHAVDGRERYAARGRSGAKRPRLSDPDDARERAAIAGEAAP